MAAEAPWCGAHRIAPRGSAAPTCGAAPPPPPPLTGCPAALKLSCGDALSHSEHSAEPWDYAAWISRERSKLVPMRERQPNGSYEKSVHVGPRGHSLDLELS